MKKWQEQSISERVLNSRGVIKKERDGGGCRDSSKMFAFLGLQNSQLPVSRE